MSAYARRRALAAVAAIALAALGHPLARASPPPLAADVPACEVGDRVVAGDPERDAATLTLDLAWRLPPGWAPTDLVGVSEAGFEGPHPIRAVVIDDLRALREAAESAGLRLAVQSGYRSEAYQERVYAGWVDALGPDRAAEVSARPGHSEHQLGTAVDLRGADGPPAWDLDDWSTTPEGAWVADHAYRFGFVVNYPRGERDTACYDYEPWHLRWVGGGLATKVQAHGVPLRVWLHHAHPPTERASP